MRFHFRWLAAMCLIVPAIVNADDLTTNSEAVSNGCGTGWNRWLVPDSIPMVKCDFVAACHNHDVCYGKCEGRARDPKAPECAYLLCKPGGAKEGSRECVSSVAMTHSITDAEIRRNRCDVALGNEIIANNGNRRVCLTFANVYRNAVKRWGADAFQGIGDGGTILRQKRDDYDGAIRDLFRFGTEAEFERVDAAMARGDLDLEKPIAYVRGRGIVNLETSEP
ncbi:hypothetical protein [Chiayiivirga flava]|uniref:Uncharacterized protein n=1 Tax=Chiayiivirga flava TaxID=659595 RepID=A0A7W8D2P2_9GAMM|nr:hypothetical protein [Chiayiivirga flava]MBB5206860.1 hypothetical protein [Chiayiivirga flava]